MSQTAQITNLLYGPFRTFQSNVARDLAEHGNITDESTDWLVDPRVGSLIRRKGSAPLGATSGLLLNSDTWRARRCLGVRFPSTTPSSSSSFLTDGYETHVALWTVEQPSGSNPQRGSIYWRNTNSGGSHAQAGKVGTVITNLRTVHMLGQTGSGTDAYFRPGDSDAQTEQIGAGARGMETSGGWVFLSGFLSMPCKWRPPVTESAVTTERIFPTGHCPPLWAPTVAATTGSADAAGTWKGADRFYVTVQFVYEDGSAGPIMRPRKPNANLPKTASAPGGLGLVSPLDSANPSSTYLSVTLTDIPIGEYGVKKRRIWRTPKNDASDPDNQLDFRLWEEINNNTQTTLVSTKGNDAELSLGAIPEARTQEEALISALGLDEIWPPRARYMFPFDGRTAVAYTQLNPAAIILTPHKSNAGASTNGDDSATGIPATSYQYWHDTTNHLLKLTDDAGATHTDIDTSSTKTVQDVVDLINATTTSGAAGQWAAQLVPGSDANAAASEMFGSSASDYRNAYNNAMYGLLFMGSTYRNRFPNRPQRVVWTKGGPGLPVNAANSYGAKNERDAIQTAGICMGGGPILDGAIVVFTNGYAVLRNIRGGKTGLDDDYRLEFLPGTPGCICPASVTWGAGVVSWMSRDGYVVADASGYVRISGYVYDGATATGAWSYEVGQCLAAAGADADTGLFAAAFVGRSIHVTYRDSLNVTRPSRRMTYDFSASPVMSGIDAFLRDDGKPWPWSAPLTNKVSVMGTVNKSDGMHIFGAVESSTSNTGRIEELDTTDFDAGTTQSISCVTTIGLTAITGAFTTVPVGATITGTAIQAGTTVALKLDNSNILMSLPAVAPGGTQTLTFGGTEVQPLAYWGLDFVGTILEKCLVDAPLSVYSKKALGMSISLSTKQDRSDETLYPLLAQGVLDVYKKYVVPIGFTQRGPSECYEFGVRDDGTGTYPVEFKRLDVPVETLDARR